MKSPPENHGRGGLTFLTAYATYDEANLRQLDLMAAGIEARVDYVPGGHAAMTTMTGGEYHLCVEAGRHDEAWEIVSPELDPDAASIAACPKCGSSEVREVEFFSLLHVPLLMIPSAVEFVRSRISGARFTCEECHHTYRKKLTGPTS